MEALEGEDLEADRAEAASAAALEEVSEEASEDIITMDLTDLFSAVGIIARFTAEVVALAG